MNSFIKQFLNQKNRNIISIFIIIFGIGYLINYSFYTPTYINKYIATNIYKEPANSYFDDDNFYQCVVDAYNKENKTELPYTASLSDEQLESITSLSCSGYKKSDEEKIASAKGLEKLKMLTTLDVSNNQLTELDVSKNTVLTSLRVDSNQLTELDVSNNTELTGLDLSGNQLTSIDVSNNTELTGLDLSDNQLTELDVSNNTELTCLFLSGNQLTSIDVSKNTTLKYGLSLSNNQLTTLDVSNNILLLDLRVNDNQLTSIDVSNNTELTGLYLSGNQLTSIDVSKNTRLTHLYLSANQLKQLDVDKNTRLGILTVSNNQLTSIDVSKNTRLSYLYLNTNQLKQLDVDKNTKLRELYVYENQLKELDISKNTEITWLIAYGNLFNNEMYIYKGNAVNAVNKVKVVGGSVWECHEWNSNNNSIATVSDTGVINALSIGTTNVTGTGIGTYGAVGATYRSYTTTNTVHVIEITSDNYMIDDNSIYILDDKDIDDIKNNIVVPENITLDIDLDNKKLYVKHEDDVVKEFNLVTINSDKYDILDNSIILYNDMDINTIKNNININSDDIDLSIDNNKLILKYNEEILKEFDIVSYISNKYDLSKDKIILQGESDIDLDNINTINCTKEVKDNKLVIKYKDNIIKEFNIMKGIEFGELKVNNHNIVLDKEIEISYREFVSNISTNEGYSYKIYNNDKEVDENNNIIGGMILKIYYNDEEVDSYNITYDYLEFDKELDIVEDIKLINNIIVGTTIESIKNSIKTSGNVSIVDKNNNVISNLDNKIKTGDKFKIDVYGSILEYTASVKGDSDGDGDINVMDIIEIVDTIVDNKELDSAYYNASDYNNDNTIDVMDIIDIVDYIVK